MHWRPKRPCGACGDGVVHAPGNGLRPRSGSRQAGAASTPVVVTRSGGVVAEAEHALASVGILGDNRLAVPSSKAALVVAAAEWMCVVQVGLDAPSLQ